LADRVQHRAQFLDTFIKASPVLGTVFLNHSGAPEKLLSDIQAIDILAEKEVFKRTLLYIKSNQLVSNVHLIPKYGMNEIWVEFLDHTELRFRMFHSFTYKGIRTISAKFIRENSITNNYGMLVPNEEVHFEYLILHTQFGKTNMADRYRNYFGSLTFEERSRIFGHIHSRFSLVIHTLNDLYEYKPGTNFKMVLALRKRKGNSLFRIFLRLTGHLFFGIMKPVLFREKTHESNSEKIEIGPRSEKKDPASGAAVS
jgi:hypothetical protein